MKKIKQSHFSFGSVFRLLAVFILFGYIGIYYLFIQTSSQIKERSFQSDIAYIDTITTNIANKIKKETTQNIVETLQKNPHLREELESSLQLFITPKYRYIYVVDKQTPNATEFRFLLDGSVNEEDKSEFKESYTPYNFEKWNEAYQLQKVVFFRHTAIKSLWLTYLKPIVINGKTQALIVVDFSLEDHKKIVQDFDALDKVLLATLLFGTVIFILVVIFSYIDQKRTQQLKEQNEKIQELNKNLALRIEEEVAKNREKDKQLLQQSRLAQMGEMIAMIAHQWRQPLSAINSAASVIILKIKMKKYDEATTMELSQKIIDFSNHLSTTIDDFRNFFKPNKSKEEVKFKEIIESVLGIIDTSLANKQIKVIKDIASDKVFHTYPNEIKQVLLNLIKNAEDVLIERKIEDPVIIIEARENRLMVKDNGGGIDEVILEKIFDPYFSTKSEKNGTGLGLYMSKIIIEDHCGGKLYASNENGFTVFTIELPQE